MESNLNKKTFFVFKEEILESRLVSSFKKRDLKSSKEARKEEEAPDGFSSGGCFAPSFAETSADV